MDKFGFEREKLLKKVRQKVSRAGLDALVVSEEHDMLYLTGFFCKGAKLLVRPGKKPVYFIDGMNAALARAELEDLRTLDIISGPVLKNLKTSLKDLKIKKLGINENNVTVFENNWLIDGVKRIAVKPALQLTEELRAIKSDLELKQIRKAAKDTVKIWRRVKKNVSLRMTEKDIARMVDTFILESGAENSFPTIAAIGKNSAYPHAVPTLKRLKSGELLLVDMGMRYNGYCSDLTRTYYTGRIDRQIRDFIKYVRIAHDLAIKKLKPGVLIGPYVRSINNILKQYGTGEYMLHGLGHGVGRGIHEDPFLYEGSNERIKAGMVVTIEPGLYKPGLGGARLEDMVLITKTGCEVLTV